MASVNVLGDHPIARELASLVRADRDLTVSASKWWARFTIEVREWSGHSVALDLGTRISSDEQHVLDMLSRLLLGVLVRQGEGDASDNHIVVSVPIRGVGAEDHSRIAHALYRAVLRAAHIADPTVKRSWWWPFGIAPVLLLLASPARAQVIQQAGGTGSAVTAAQGAPGASAWHVDFLAAQHMICDSGCTSGGGGGTSIADKGTFTFGTTALTPAGGVFDDTPPTALTTGMAGVARVTANRAFHVNLRNASGTELATLSNPLRVDPTGTTAQPVSGTVTANAGTGTFSVSGTVTANAGTNLNTSALALDATLTGGTARTKVTDGTNNAAVKAASTAAAATDPALVVAVSPNNSVAVTGTFFQATQPVSGTVTANIGTTNGLALDASVTGLEVAQASTTSGQKGVLAQGAVTTAAPSYTTAQTSPLSLTTAGGLRVDGSGVTQPVSGTVTTTPPANASTNVAQFGGTNVSTGTGAGGAGIPRVTVSNDSTVNGPTITKGTQGSTGFTTQDLKDAGRTSVMLTASVASTATAETLITLTKSAGLAATTTCSSCSITTGKKFRIQAIAISARNSTGTTTSNVTVNLRGAVGGATTTASPLQQHYVVNVPASAASVLFPTLLIPDGFEIDSNSATNTYGVTITHPQFSSGTIVVTFDITIVGYEY